MIRIVVASVLLFLVCIGCRGAFKEGGGIVITNEYRGGCISAQPGRGSLEYGRTLEGAPCSRVETMGMVPVFTYRW